MLARRSVMLEAWPATMLRDSASVAPQKLPGPSTAVHSVFSRGRKIARSLGTTQSLRVNVVFPLVPNAKNTPPRNHTGPDWPTPHFAPVRSTRGWMTRVLSGGACTGIESAHCHHCCDHCP